MKSRIALATLIAGLAVASPHVSAGTVISSDDVTLNADDVKQLYNGDMQSKGSTRLTAVDNSAEQANFLAKVMGTDASKYQNHWTKKSFREGLNPPNVSGTDAEVIKFVKQTPGGVGYISGTAPAGVKVVESY
jgi:hypothetical protein